MREKICPGCGELKVVRAGRTYCSDQCKPVRPPRVERVRVSKPQPEPIDQRAELRRGYEDGDAELFFAALVSRADTTGDCWIWPDVRDGYPTTRIRRVRKPLHRMVLEIKHGAPLGSQAAHHTCANTTCVNPDHLQPVTHRDNIAEMLARQSYLNRIRDLEAALAATDPTHPLLTVIAVA